MTSTEAGKAILLFGLPESGVDALARAAQTGGAVLAADASLDAKCFAISTALDGVAGEINAALGIKANSSGPVAIGNQSLAVSRTRIDRHLEEYLDRARAAVRTAMAGDLSAPILVVAGQNLSVFPRFWFKAFARGGISAQPILVHRNPFAVAMLARAARHQPLRQTLFLWHHLALDLLRAAPEAIVIPATRGAHPAIPGLPAHWMLPKHEQDDTDCTTVPIMAEQTRALARLLDEWPTLDRAAKNDALADLGARFDEAVTLSGTARIVKLHKPIVPAASVAIAPAAPSKVAPATISPTPRSPLLVHFHIFKNAGTSIDKMLKRNFGEAWLEKEFNGGPRAQLHAEFTAFLAEQRGIKAFSSHTASLPLPDLPDREIFPIIFVRHPLLRLRSAYQFERRQDAQTRGAILAKTTDLRGYLAAFLESPKLRFVRNFQAFRFASGTPGHANRELDRALETLTRLPFVGLVEAYERSIERLGELIRPAFPDFQVIALHENATATLDEGSVEDKLAALRDELGAELYDRLRMENAYDLELYERVRATYPA